MNRHPILTRLDRIHDALIAGFGAGDPLTTSSRGRERELLTEALLLTLIRQNSRPPYRVCLRVG